MTGQVPAAGLDSVRESDIERVDFATCHHNVRSAISIRRWAGILVATELLGCVFAALATFPATSSLSLSERYVWLAVAGFTGVWIVQTHILSLYGRATLLAGVRENLQRGLLAGAFALGLLLLLGFMTKLLGAVSRAWFLTWTLCVFVHIAAVRLCWSVYMDRALSRGGCVERAVVLAESHEVAARLARTIRDESDGRIGIVFSMPIPDMDARAAVMSIEQAIRDDLCDRVIIGGFERMAAQVGALLERLTLVAVDVTVLPSLVGLGASITGVDRIGSLPAVGLASRPLSAGQAFLKRTEDLVIATVALALLAPAFVIIAILVRLDGPGPVLFAQLREGYNGRIFWLLKFRTMHVSMADPSAARQTSRNDPRVTRVGRILRRLSLDELPQLVNVLRGDMSVVGPRPHALGMTTRGLPLQEVLATYNARHRLRPGITGWAQVRNCRGEINTEDKLRRRVFLDCEYINRWSLSLDLWIILRTFCLVTNDRNAY